MESIQDTGRRNVANLRRGPAESHFGKLNRTAALRQEGRAATAEGSICENAERTSCTFEVYRADEVRMTSTQFGGGDWHWRLSDADGQVLLDTGGYASERECRDAIAILQENAGWATVTAGS
jgi:uncharacterized protein YegP (UPF0339 family)